MVDGSGRTNGAAGPARTRGLEEDLLAQVYGAAVLLAAAELQASRSPESRTAREAVREAIAELRVRVHFAAEFEITRDQITEVAHLSPEEVDVLLDPRVPEVTVDHRGWLG